MLDFSILEIITIITAFQLLMLSVVLLSKERRKKISNRILSWYMLSNALLLIHFLFTILGIYNLPSVSIFYYLLGPLIYLYVRSMCVKNFKIESGYWIHGIIFAIMIIYVIIKALFIKNEDFVNWNYTENLISQIILHIQIAFYIFASLLSIFQYRKEIKNLYSDIDQISLSWLLLIILTFATMWMTDFIAFIIGIFLEGSVRIIYFLIVASITINWLFANYLVYRGLNQPNAFSGLKTPDKYSGSNITMEKSSTMAINLKYFMQDKKPFLNPDLTIKDLSDELTIHPKFLSQVINSQFDQNFFDYINQYRVKEAQGIISDNSDEKMTILEILYEVGFNSKSSFNKAFKKYTGKTPTEFKKLAYK
jgi:AraC-like DNA-binding protein